VFVVGFGVDAGVAAVLLAVGTFDNAGTFFADLVLAVIADGATCTTVFVIGLQIDASGATGHFVVLAIEDTLA
jgi:hypothetical protein